MCIRDSITIPAPIVEPVVPQHHQGDLTRFVLVGERVLLGRQGRWEETVGRPAAAVRALGGAGDADLLGVDVGVGADWISLGGVNPRPPLRGEVARAVAKLLDARTRHPVRLAS